MTRIEDKSEEELLQERTILKLKPPKNQRGTCEAKRKKDQHRAPGYEKSKDFYRG